MKHITALILPLAFSALAAGNAQAFETQADHAIILDYETGAVLYSYESEAPMVPASMTKIMTAYMVFERLSDGRLSPEDTFTVSERAWREGGWASGGSTMGLAIGQEVSVADLLHGMIVQSGNDACIVLAEGISGSEEAFADLMSARAQEMGLETAHFENATGLFEEGHEISAHDLARLAQMTIENFPNYYRIYNVRDFEWNGISQPNRNPLLYRFNGADGLKTGHLSQSGYGVVGSAEVDGVRRIIVLNGMESETARAAESERIMRAAFREFSLSEPFADGAEVGMVPVWLGSSDHVSAIIREDVVIAYESAARNDLSADLIVPDMLSAPVSEGDEIGTLEIRNSAEVIGSFPVYAGSDVSRSGLLSRAISGVSALISPGSSEAPSEASGES